MVVVGTAIRSSKHSSVGDVRTTTSLFRMEKEHFERDHVMIWLSQPDAFSGYEGASEAQRRELFFLNRTSRFL